MRRTKRRARPALAWLLAPVLAWAPGLLLADPAQQELAGPVRPRETALSLQPAMSGTPAPPEEADAPILFAAGSALLTPRATRALDRLGASLTASAAPAGRFRLEGHGDGGGSPATAHDLARRRAEAVAGYLEQNCAVAASRLDVATSALRPARQVRVIDLPP